MNGYLMQEKEWTPGEDLFVESFSPESNYGVVFEEDGEAAYFYAVEKDGKEQSGIRILDALHINEKGETGPPGSSSRLQIVWARDWMKAALVIDGYCHALFDFVAQGGYNINEFPPPNEFWTKGDRKLSMELMKSLF